MAKIPGLQLKGKMYVLRLHVPKDVQAHFKSKVVVRTLETRDYDMAAKRIHAVRAGVEAEFEKIQQKTKAQQENTRTSALDHWTDYYYNAPPE